jgi:hypothetical protein
VTMPSLGGRALLSVPPEGGVQRCEWRSLPLGPEALPFQASGAGQMAEVADQLDHMASHSHASLPRPTFGAPL